MEINEIPRMEWDHAGVDGVDTLRTYLGRYLP